LVDVVGCCETVPDCADALSCDEYCDESSEEEEFADDVVAVDAFAADCVVVALWCAATAIPPTRRAVVPTLSATAPLRLRRAGWGRGRFVMRCMIGAAIEVPVGAGQEEGKNC
jgi:hypothetical protein